MDDGFLEMNGISENRALVGKRFGFRCKRGSWSCKWRFNPFSFQNKIIKLIIIQVLLKFVILSRFPFSFQFLHSSLPPLKSSSTPGSLYRQPNIKDSKCRLKKIKYSFSWSFPLVLSFYSFPHPPSKKNQSWKRINSAAHLLFTFFFSFFFSFPEFSFSPVFSIN